MDITLKHIKSGAGLPPLEEEGNDFWKTINPDKSSIMPLSPSYEYLSGFYDGVFCEQNPFELCYNYLKGFYEGVKVREKLINERIKTNN